LVGSFFSRAISFFQIFFFSEPIAFFLNQALLNIFKMLGYKYNAYLMQLHVMTWSLPDSHPDLLPFLFFSSPLVGEDSGEGDIWIFSSSSI
jgi:hypothetical protein